MFADEDGNTKNQMKSGLNCKTFITIFEANTEVNLLSTGFPQGHFLPLQHFRFIPHRCQGHHAGKYRPGNRRNGQKEGTCRHAVQGRLGLQTQISSRKAPFTPFTTMIDFARKLSGLTLCAFRDRRKLI